MLTTIGIFVTTRCDLRCAHCLRGHYEGQEHQDFSLDLLTRLLEEGRPFGARQFGFTGGELCLHPEFSQMVAMVVDAGYRWSFVSNGQRSEPYCSLMTRFRSAFKSANLSLDGADAKTHDGIRCSGGHSSGSSLPHEAM
jgi:MoaA/NifB/PqqE/SkfB family radical SAM enzyme